MLKMLAACTLVILLCPTAFAEAPAEVEAAREAAKRHNESIEAAQERLERDLARAKAAHAQAVIDAKQRMIEDLRRAFRTAMRSDASENSVKIAEQIKRLEQQVVERKAHIQTLLSSKPDDAEPLAGLNPKLVGYVALPTHKLDRFNRLYHIDEKGQARVIADASVAQTGLDVGETYQGRIVNGRFVVHADKWTTDGNSKGRVQQFTVIGDEVEFRHASFEDYRRNVASTWRAPLSMTVFATLDDFKAAEENLRHKLQPVEPDKAPQPEPDEDQDHIEIEEPEARPDDGVEDFFGVPIE